jgi:hypothetical protein
VCEQLLRLVENNVLSGHHHADDKFLKNQFGVGLGIDGLLKKDWSNNAPS